LSVLRGNKMPLYEYECPKHGVFTESKPLKDYQKKAECPKCKKECVRVITKPVPKSQSWKTY